MPLTREAKPLQRLPAARRRGPPLGAGRRRRPPRPRRRSGSRPASGRAVGASTGSDRSEIGSRVVDGGTPGRTLISVACRARASGRRRATTRWSAPLAAASSSTMAPTIASSDTERDSPDRIRANDSASARRPCSRAMTASRWRSAARPAIATRPATIQSRGRACSASSRRTSRDPRRTNVPAKIHQERRIRRSVVAPSRPGRGFGSLTSDMEDGGPEASRPSPRVGPWSRVGTSTFVLGGRSDGRPAAAWPPSRLTR